jgi:2,4-dienoyl-CoA reductase-like NADH-dependent reductase (Old Yellow Enzyme family)/NADPH-dependent 2,4-dienoyl-CoA reductase/sulfur reductase-like enzyme
VKLLEPITLADGKLRVKNRIVMPPMGMGYANDDGTVTERLVEYYRARARSGVGMIVVENCIVDPDVLGVGPELQLHADYHVPGLARLAETVKGYGSVVGLQLNHMGRQTTLGTPVAPSPISISERGPAPRVLTKTDIEFVINEFVSAAQRVQKAGFDFVELHGAHGYLMCEFLSPLANKRDDEFGGDFDRRLRFPLDIIRGIRQTCGENFPIQFRLSGSEYYPGGLTLAETTRIASRLADAGVCSISVSAGNWQTLRYIMAPMFIPQGYLVDDAGAIKFAVKVPVIAVGRIHSVKVAEQALVEGKADLVALGRALIADPDWALKLQDNRPEDIRPCISCNACVDLVSRAQEAKCTVNAGLGREGEFQIARTHHPHRVLVVGAGPAGLEAARVSAARGHKVTLVEKSERLGGKLHVSAASPSKGEIRNFIEYLSRQVHKLGVDIQTGRQLNQAAVLGLKPDLIVNATGSYPALPPIAGVRSPHVKVAEDVMMERTTVGKKVAIIGGGGTGCELAEWLLHRGHAVAIIEMMAHIGMNIEAITRRWMYYELKKAKVPLLTRCKVLRIEGDGVVYCDHNGEERTYSCDAAVIALGYRPNDDLSFCDEERFPIPTYKVGDAERPGTILDAVTGGANLGARI